MSYEFTVAEEKGEKLYKLLTVRLFHREGIKIISKEDFSEGIHFCIYLGRLDSNTQKFTTRELKYKSVDEGVTKEDFESFIGGLIARLPEGAEVFVNDLSVYQTLKEQFRKGLSKNFMKVVSLAE